MIDKVLVLTLERCIERHWSFLGASRMRGIPTEKITFVQGHDGNDFEDMTEIAIHAAADGFEFVENYAIGTKTEFVQQTNASVSQIWNYARIFRHISEHQETCLILNDDKMITVVFDILNTIADELERREDSEEFFLFQLRHRADLNEMSYYEKDRFQQFEFTEKVFNGMFNQIIPSYSDFFLKKGVMGYEESMIITPAGANWILRTLEDADDFYIFYDHFIHKKLTTEAAIAVQNGKGVWTTAESGYSFVDEIMPMGTTTDWAPKDSHHYKEAHKKTEIKWEDIL